MRAQARNRRHSEGSRTVWCAVVAGMVLLAGASVAHSTLTTPSCLAKKLKEWGKLRTSVW